ncbi:MAG: helix-hairpin-helix domain-containing protein [Methanobacteriaceae archaeon]
MNTLKKMQVLSDSAQFDLCDCVNHVEHTNSSSVNLPGIYHTSASGCSIPIFKVLMTNNCQNDCKYCINQSKRSFTRLALDPGPLTKVFLDYYNKKYVNGLFLSSGISGSIDESMEKVVEVARSLRLDHGFKDYIHLKILPGTSKDLIKRAMTLANRVSINIEAATSDGLNELCSTKDYNKDILKRISWVDKLKEKNPELAPSGHTTQFIVGATDESDNEILNRVSSLYKKVDLKRSYFSAFNPVEDTPLEKRDECSEKRALHLYNSDALINSYNFKLNEFAFDESGFLSLDEDPKYLAAKNNINEPVELNSASYQELIRVPGIGPITAKNIIANRGKQIISDVKDLKSLGVIVNRAEPFIRLNGSHQKSLEFFS